ncbi:uncharacterized protein N7496_011181 [Penicillium cataractarum]|uniref:3'-5' exonuclease domain-containing protein n=1 Tax=Penicillium cataractarum TaxID=2100454 RepID=A0A9W9RJM5_9EURO|nr:uncharacterized protein N7496_011181 [Penicillium cataractarum]KAJ5358768.1 hypothetical protein N7496_011181 [Penicillium cataractarum]
MRGWATLPAGLRYPSLVSTAHGDLPGHGSLRLGVCWLTYQCHASSSPHSLDRPKAPRNRLYRVRGPQITRWEPRRAFSGTPRAQIIIIDDDEEVEVPPPPQNGLRRVNALGVVHQNINELIRTRETRLKEQAKERAKTPLDRKKLKDIKKKARVLEDHYKLSDEFLQLKYAYVEHCLSQSAKAIEEAQFQYDSLVSTYVSHLENRVEQIHQNSRYLEHEFCEIAFRPLGFLSKQLSISAREIESLQVAVFSQSVDISQQLINDLRALLDREYLKPRKSARSRIDRLLAHAETAAGQYNDLQAKGTAVINGLNAISALLRSLMYLDSQTGSIYKPLIEANDSIANEFALSSHEHRWRWRTSRRFENPLGDAFLLESSNLIESRAVATTTLLPSKVVSAVLFDDKEHRKIKAIMAKQDLRVADHIRKPYLQKWRGPKPSWSTELNKYWRQLDVLAPFELHRMYITQLSKEVLNLVPTVQGGFGPMWEGLNDHDRKINQAHLSDWYTNYRKSQKDFLRELEMYRYINWYRLGLEEKLAKLGVPNPIQAQKLFVPSEPLSQDMGRFNQWIHKMVEIRQDGWISEMAFRMIREPNGLDTWLEMMDRFRKEAAERKSQILDLGSVRVRRRGVSQKKAKVSRFAKSKKNLRRKTARSVRSKPAWKPASKPSAKEATNSHWKLKLKDELSHESPKPNSSKIPANEKKSRSPLPKSPSNSQKISSPQKRQAARSKLAPAAVWDYLGQAKKFIPQPAPVDAKTRFRQAMSMKDETWSDRTTGKPKTIKSTAGRPSTPTPKPLFPGGKTSVLKQGHHQKSENVKHDASTKGKPSPARKPLKSPKRNFWDPNPVASPGGLFQRSKGRSYSTGSAVSSDHALDCNHPVLPESAPHFDVRPTLDADPELPISAEDAYHLEIESTSTEEAPLFWSHSDQRAPDGQRPIVHYCKSLESTESVVQHFLDSKVVGFDMEWKAQASATDSIQNNLSLIQLANEERIALFQIALFKPARSLEDFVAPSLKRIIESPDITKVGVSIKADSTRLRKYLGVEARSIFELSHLYKLVKYGQTQPKLVNKRSVNLSEQVEEHLGLPLEKSEDVRCGDWARSLNYRQVQYAATDPYACICLFNIMEQKRQAMNPVPPRPAHAELNLPITCPTGEAVNVENRSVVPGIVDGDVVDRS